MRKVLVVLGGVGHGVGLAAIMVVMSLPREKR